MNSSILTVRKSAIYPFAVGIAVAMTSMAWAGPDGRISSLELQNATFNVRADALTGGAGTNFHGSLFYLNDSVLGGNLLAGQIGWGVWEIDRTGIAANFIQTNATLSKGNLGSIGSPPIGAKSAVVHDTHVFLGANNHAGIARFDATDANAWSTASLTPLKTEVVLNHHVESITTDGTLLFTNESHATDNRGTVHAYSVTDDGPNDFILNSAWTTDISTLTNNAAPRFRGLAYANNGYVYGVDTGDGGAGSIWAFNANPKDAITDGTAFKVVDYQDPAGIIGNNFLGEPNAGFGVIVREGITDTGVAVDELIVVGTGGFLSTFELSDPTTVVPNSQIDFDLATLMGLDPGVEVALYGAAVDGVRDTPHFMWLSFETSDEQNDRRVAGFAVINPEPSSLAIFAVGGVWLVGRRRSKWAAA